VDEIYAPDVVLIPGTQPDDRAVLVIEAFPLLVTLRYLEALFPPQPFYLLVIDLPAFNAKQLGNLPVAIIAAILFANLAKASRRLSSFPGDTSYRCVDRATPIVLQAHRLDDPSF
jgi:hypothetical protein